MDDYYLIGIGGIGMSALARLLMQKGKNVSGSDSKESNLIKLLRKEGVHITIGHEGNNINNTNNVVFSSAIKDDNPEMIKAKFKKVNIIHRADLLNNLMEKQDPLLVGGTHGKTTVSSLLSEVLIKAKADPSFAVGGIINSLNVNASYGNGKYFVAEADESDGSFLKLQGFGCIITNIDYDHLDYWKEKENVIEGFKKFFCNIKSKEHFFYCKDDENLKLLNPEGVSYGFDENADLRIENFSQNEFLNKFDIVFENVRYKDITIPLIGKHNALNAAAVFGLCLKLSIDAEVIKKAFLSFSGVHRRLQKIANLNNVLFFDDYAHHPSEIKATLSSLKEAVKEKRIIALFQPHRYSRTKNFLKEFSMSFDKADIVIVTDIYSAGEKEQVISSQDLVNNITESQAYYVKYDELVSFVKKILRPNDVVITLGAGNITSIGPVLKDEYIKSPNKYKVGLFFGGHKTEHSVSIKSASYVDRCLDKTLYDVTYFYITKDNKWLIQDQINGNITCDDMSLVISFALNCDVCMPVLHGPIGEDGTIQGFFKTFNKVTVSCDYLSCGICMDKGLLKKICSLENIDNAKFLEFTIVKWKEDNQKCIDKILNNFKYPFIVKPSHLGSSVGVEKVVNYDQLIKVIENAFILDDKLLVEEEIKGRQIEFGVIGTDCIEVASPGEIFSNNEIYSNERKYGSNPMETKVPADLPVNIIEKGKQIAKKAYQVAGCSVFARVDFFLDENNNYILNEINPIPGCTSISLFPQVWDNENLKGKDLIDRLIISGLYKNRVACKG
jgi:UDP-N-acetylmuramate--alanine ligase